MAPKAHPSSRSFSRPISVFPYSLFSFFLSISFLPSFSLLPFFLFLLFYLSSPFFFLFFSLSFLCPFLSLLFILPGSTINTEAALKKTNNVFCWANPLQRRHFEDEVRLTQAMRFSIASLRLRKLDNEDR